jgi:glutathione peroxidase
MNSPGSTAVTSLYDIAVERIDGTMSSLGDYRGKVLLIVNVASKCGLTPQYEGLERLYRAKRKLGFEILAFPANDFRDQEELGNASK